MTDVEFRDAVARGFRCLDGNGKQISSAALHGKVVVAQFLSTTCQHCQAFSRLLTKFQADYGRGVSRPSGLRNDADLRQIIGGLLKWRDYSKR